ncbi:TolB-like protein [Candidatus Koribacter versatilis Ellin345]|uniref:TolB-like protein n=2 Tax=Candidatus Korobacter versatilis TaxID=658062 RepID=Q1IU53_KORVE|nr:TolB-like protein [Candidatus Koribacter versatilis Ellin345]
MLRKLFLPALLLIASLPLTAQTDWIKTGTNLGVEKVRLAVPDFKAGQGSESLSAAFDQTLWNDLYQAGLFDLVSKSFNPTQAPGQPSEVELNTWGAPPPNASMLAFGNINVANNEVTVQGWLYDVKNPQTPQVLGKQYKNGATVENTRLIAHKFADEIIFRLGGGIQGIAESKIYFISTRTGHKEIWAMDYDGSNQKPITHLGSIVLSPRASPDGARVAYSWMTNGWEIGIYSTELGRSVNFARLGGTNSAPAFSGDGNRLAFSSSRSGDPEIYTSDISGANLKRLTNVKGPDTSPTWNPKTNAQIAFVSGRTGLPQIYTMDVDGSNVIKMTDQGYAISPSWSPNGQFLVFAWTRHYGPGAPGAQDIYIMDVASHQWVQLTHDGGRNDFPSWAPDGRHVVFQSSRSGREEIWSMLADGSQQTQLTNSGANSMPNWSSK